MFIQKLRLQNYRCFEAKTFSFDKPFVLIEGDNGSGKTTILEALHYGCFLKSFRTTRVKDLVSFDQNHFFIQVDFEEKAGDHNQVHIGVSIENNKKKRLVRFNKKEIKSYRDLISHYRVVSLSEEDLELVQGAPEVRRSFLNQLVVLFDPSLVSMFKTYRQILEHRNSMLINGFYNRQSNEELKVWSQQLWEQSILIQTKRIEHLKNLEAKINVLLKEYFPKFMISVSFSYTRKNKIAQKNNFDDFWKDYKDKKVEDEYRMRRSLFGAHLDDFTISFQKDSKSGIKARSFASRGQQKLVVFLIKIALAKQLEEQHTQVSLLLDDFLTDFDHTRLSDCLSLLSSLSCQVFITCPLESLLMEHCNKKEDEIQILTL